MKTELELQALRNAIKLEGMEVRQSYTNDSRKTVGVYFLTHNKNCVSPTVCYDKLNHFIAGFNRAVEILTKTKN